MPPGRTHYIDQLDDAVLAALEQEALKRIDELKDELADAEAGVEQIKLARAEQQHRVP